MPSSSQDFELARLLATLVAVAALLGSLASTAGNTHTAVANQLRLLISEFHKWNLAEPEDRVRALHHLEVLQTQIYYFQKKARTCAYIHMLNYAALCAGFSLVPLTPIVSFLPPLGITLLSLHLVVVLVTAIFRIRELSPGNTTIELASTEVLGTQFEKPMGLGILERSN